MYLFFDLEGPKNNFLFKSNLWVIEQIPHHESESNEEQELNKN